MRTTFLQNNVRGTRTFGHAACAIGGSPSTTTHHAWASRHPEHAGKGGCAKPPGVEQGEGAKKGQNRVRKECIMKTVTVYPKPAHWHFSWLVRCAVPLFSNSNPLCLGNSPFKNARTNTRSSIVPRAASAGSSFQMAGERHQQLEESSGSASAASPTTAAASGSQGATHAKPKGDGKSDVSGAVFNLANAVSLHAAARARAPLPPTAQSPNPSSRSLALAWAACPTL